MHKQAQLAAFIVAAGLIAMAQDSAPGSHVYKVNGEWVEEITGTLPAGANIKVKTVAGPIRLIGARQDHITYTVRKRLWAASSEEAARREFANLRFSAVTTGDTALLRGECGKRGIVGFELNVPVGTSFVRLDTNGGSIDARSIAGKVEAVTGGDSIQLEDIGSSVYAFSGGGNIEIGKIGGDVRVETGGGNIHVASAGGQVIASTGGGTLTIGTGKTMNLKTGGGAIRVNKCAGLIKASTGGGSIDLNDIDGPAQVESGGGSIRVGPVRGGLRVDTSGGPIVVDLAKDGVAFTDSRLETSSGDIIVYLPDDFGVTVHAAVELSRGFGIRTEFSQIKITSGDRQWGPHEIFAEGALNGGGPILHVHATNGTIEFKRKHK